MPAEEIVSPPIDRAAAVCCLLTASGRGAVAVVGLNGDEGLQAATLDRLFTPIGSRSFREITGKPIVYGRWRSSGEDLVVARSSQGYEIQCHGGNVASAAVIRDLESCGFQLVEAAQWRTLCGSLWQAETEQALCDAITERTAGHLLRVLTLQNDALHQLNCWLKDDNAQVALQTLKNMMAWSGFGSGLTQPHSVVFCGQPNVGKSSLVNAIVGFQRAIVNQQAGTTRDVLSQSTAIDGWPVVLKDTAGIRETTGQIEKLGIQKAEETIADADVRIAVFDATQSFGASEMAMVKSLKPHLVVFNKSDLAPDFEFPNFDVETRPLAVSAIARTGLKKLMTAIAHTMVPSVPPNDQWYPVTTSQADRLQSAARWLDNANCERALNELRLGD